MVWKRKLSASAKKKFTISFFLTAIPLFCVWTQYSSNNQNVTSYIKEDKLRRLPNNTSLSRTNTYAYTELISQLNVVPVNISQGRNNQTQPSLNFSTASAAKHKSSIPVREATAIKPKPVVSAKQLKQKHPQRKPDQHKVILLWNTFFVLPDFGLGMGTSLFEETKCSHTCILTADKGLLSTADSVIIHAFHLIKDLFNASIPQRVSKEQIFVFFILENPHRSYPGLMNLDYDNLFNLAFTYLDDPRTDIFAPYGLVKKRKNVEDSAVPSIEVIKKKTKLVVWLLSNCRAPSARYEYANLLEKHIPIDIFGKCGNDSCPKSEKCMDLVDKNYLFYLAFENGYCVDYITEKAYRTLGTTNMIPIVLGGANYTKHLPTHSFIDVRDFKSPQKLAEYLQHLQSNMDEYMEYFQWKKTYQIETVRSIRRAGFCKLCTILNTPNYPYKPCVEPLTYWNPNHCLNGDDEREALGIF